MQILVVDDHSDSRDMILEWVRMLGHDAVGAASVAEALAEAERSTFGALVVDLRLPDGDGAEIVRRMRAAGHTARAIALTGLPPADPAPFDAVLVKPVDLNRLAELLTA